MYIISVLFLLFIIGILISKLLKSSNIESFTFPSDRNDGSGFSKRDTTSAALKTKLDNLKEKQDELEKKGIFDDVKSQIKTELKDAGGAIKSGIDDLGTFALAQMTGAGDSVEDLKDTVDNTHKAAKLDALEDFSDEIKGLKKAYEDQTSHIEALTDHANDQEKFIEQAEQDIARLREKGTKLEKYIASLHQKMPKGV
tara:strand:- start:3736 stop:4329 length:594 start_codon:yes stop_codon:yes gene_type:complete